jgi:hypothetical protein
MDKTKKKRLFRLNWGIIQAHPDSYRQLLLSGTCFNVIIITMLNKAWRAYDQPRRACFSMGFKGFICSGSNAGKWRKFIYAV